MAGGAGVNDRYQSGLGFVGVMDTERWFTALLAGIDGPLGDVLDVGCAEGIMCALAADAGAEHVLGIGLHDDRMAAALEIASRHPNIDIREQEAREYETSHRTVLFSMMAHWLGPDETARFASLATRNFAIVFRAANDHYAIPENGTWFPTLAELDAVVGGVRTSETLLLTQDNDKEVWAATYRTDLRIEGMVIKNGRREPLRKGVDLHGDLPFRPTHRTARQALRTECHRRP
jgi:SAM-dependent methyltransferase